MRRSPSLPGVKTRRLGFWRGQPPAPESLPSVEAGTSPGRFSSARTRTRVLGPGTRRRAEGPHRGSPQPSPPREEGPGRREPRSHHALPGRTPVTAAAGLSARDAPPPRCALRSGACAAVRGRRRHDRRPASARLQPDGRVRAARALLPGSAGGAREQAAPQHGCPALGPCAQQAAPPKGAGWGTCWMDRRGWTRGTERGRVAGAPGVRGALPLLVERHPSCCLTVESWDRTGGGGGCFRSALRGPDWVINAGADPSCFLCLGKGDCLLWERVARLLFESRNRSRLGKGLLGTSPHPTPVFSQDPTPCIQWTLLAALC